MSSGRALIRHTLNGLRRYLVGPDQQWSFAQPPKDWMPPHIPRTSLYLHVPFCRNGCPYCPYTKVRYQAGLVAPYTRAAINEVNWWADSIGRAELTSVYIGGGTPTVALESVARIVEQLRRRFNLSGDICIETNPGDVTQETVKSLHAMGVTLVSLGVESFQTQSLAFLGRGYEPAVAERALSLLADSGFASVNADVMFALPGQTADGVMADLARAAQLGADQLTTYPLFTFPYTSVGEYLNLSEVRMPTLSVRRAQYAAIHRWCTQHGFARVSVWGFKRGDVPRYSSVTRDGYIGIGPGAGSHLPGGFALNTFNLDHWIDVATAGRSTAALYMPFTRNMAAWWWLYWRFYDTRIPLEVLDTVMGPDARKARQLLAVAQKTGLAVRKGVSVELTEPGAFWLHLVQNYLALDYVNKLWTAGQREPWPQAVAL